VSLRPFLFFLPLFTNVLEDAFSELHIDHPALPSQYRGEELPTASPCGLHPGDLFPDIYSGSPSLELTQSLTFMCFLLGMIRSQVYPYHGVSTPNQRRQTKWVVFGTTLALSLLLTVVAPLFLFAPGVARTSPFEVHVSGSKIPLIMVLIPLSIGVAMLRSGLFDIDVVINPALVATIDRVLLKRFGQRFESARRLGSLRHRPTSLSTLRSVCDL
jgi:hypothetical protein